jgi:hypothetical protein
MSRQQHPGISVMPMHYQSTLTTGRPVVLQGFLQPLLELLLDRLFKFPF